MQEVARLECDQAMPHLPGHHARTTSAQLGDGLPTGGLGIAVVDDQLHGTAHQVEELISVGMHLTQVRSGSDSDGDRPDR